MNHTRKLTAAAAAFLTLAALPTKADHTNLVQTINIRLSGITQGETRTNGNIVTTSANGVRVNTGSVIDALGAALGASFPDDAQLVAVTTLPDGPSSIFVRDANSSVDVTSFFSHETLSSAVTTSVVNIRTGRALETDYSIQRFALHNADGQTIGLHFDVQGIATENLSNAGTPRSDLSADVSGAGDRNGQVLILQGSITVRGRTLEVVPDDPEPPGGPNV